jgi:ElaB/YqjD/DUF883 family membrane-anchored ribosome-binding protein
MPFSAVEKPFAERIENLSEAAGHAVKKMEEQMRSAADLRQGAADCIKQSPLAAVGVAFGGGLFVGALIALAARRPIITIRRANPQTGGKTTFEEW